MKKLLTLIAFICFYANANAQYVNIPDSNFRNFLIGKYPNCFNSAGQMDTTCLLIVNEDTLNCSHNIYGEITGIQYFKKLKILDCSVTSLPSLPDLPDSLQYFDCSSNKLTNLPNLPSSLQFLRCFINKLTSLPNLPSKLEYLMSNNNLLINLPSLPSSLKQLDCGYNQLDSLPNLPTNLRWLNCYFNKLTYLPSLSNSLISLNCSGNPLSTLPILPSTLIELRCDLIPSISLSTLPNSLKYLYCNNNQLTSLPNLPNSLITLNCNNNQLTSLPNLPSSLQNLYCHYNQLYSLPAFPKSLLSITCYGNTNLNCLPILPSLLKEVSLDSSTIKCLPNYKTKPYSFILHDSDFNVFYLPVCNPTNNINHCQSYPFIQSFAFTDNNKNNNQGINEYPKHNLKLTLSNNNKTYTNIQGTAYINADSLGTYTITAQAPPLYKAVPASYTHTFNSYDTLVLDTFALQPLVIKDSLSINITPINFAARPGFKYVYKCEFENVGTTILNPNITFNYDNNVLIIDSTSNAAITNTSNSLQLAVNNFVPGQTNNFYVYTTVKTTATLGNMLQATASINGGNANAADTANTTIRGSYDPNDKQATPNLSVTEVADNNHWINYTVRFQNTGNDTAFTVVVADTLDVSKLQTNTLQLTGTSHGVKATQNDNIVYFEFLNINLPDSNTNKTGSNGFVSFRVKPMTTLTNGNVVPNKASIYFDYNKAVQTNTANTFIGTLPLTLTAFGAIPKEEQNKIFVYWNTANEVNTSYFIIEQSTDARTFTAAAEVAAKGKGNNSYYYQLTANSQQSTVFLRLKMVDKNGTFSYSNIIRITTNDKQQTITIQSPTKNELKINVTSTTLNNTKACLINGQGKVVKTFTLKQGYQTIDIAVLQSGLYYLQTNEVVKKVVIE